MPTIPTHTAIPLALGLGLGTRVISPGLLIAGIVVSALPDADVVAFKMGIPYAAEFGHRGFSHSILLAASIAVLGALCSRLLRSTPIRTFLFLFAAMISHGLLDTFTTGGLGVALFWPFSAERFFAPLRIIRVSPIGLSAFLSQRGLAVLQSELLCVWLPALAAGLGLRATLMWTTGRTHHPEGS